jgi:hypothetical protein
MRLKHGKHGTTITLGRRDTRAWEDGGPEGHDFRAHLRALAHEIADARRAVVEIYAASSAGGWLADQVHPE